MEVATDQALSLERLVQRQLRGSSRHSMYAQQVPMFRLTVHNSGQPTKPKAQPRTSTLSQSVIVDGRKRGFRTSRYPKVCLTPELEQKVTMLSAYKALGSQAERNKDKPECKCDINPHPVRLRPHFRSDDFNLNGFREALHMERKCTVCRSSVCKCVKVVRDDLLRKISRRINKTKAKTANNFGKSEDKSASKVTKATTLQTRHTAARRSLDSSPSPQPPSHYSRYSSEGFAELAAVLQVSQASFSRCRKKRPQALRYELPAQDGSEDSEDLNERGDLVNLSPSAVLT